MLEVAWQGASEAGVLETHGLALINAEAGALIKSESPRMIEG